MASQKPLVLVGGATQQLASTDDLLVGGLPVGSRLASLAGATATAGVPIYATLAAMNADLAHAAGVLGIVDSDPATANNGWYAKSGASGAGSWTLTSLALGPAAQAQAAATAAAASVSLLGLSPLPKVAGYLKAWRSLSGYFLGGFRSSDGAFVPTAFVPPTASITRTSLTSDVQASLLPSSIVAGAMSAVTGWIYAWRTISGRFLMGIRASDGAIVPTWFVAPRLSIDRGGLTQDVQGSLLPSSIVASAMSAATGYLYAWRTISGHFLAGFSSVDGALVVTALRVLGTFALPAGSVGLSALGSDVQAKLSPAPAHKIIPFVSGGNWQLKSWSNATCVEAILTSAGSNTEAAYIPADDAVIYKQTLNGVTSVMWVPAAGGVTPAPVESSNVIAVSGDSIAAATGASTYSNGFTQKLASDTGFTVNVSAIPGQTTTQSAARQGGAPALVTVSGNQLPTSGSVPVTALSTRLLSSPAGASAGLSSMTGTLAGVHGTLNKDSGTYTNANTYADNYTFTPDAGLSSAVACPANTPFIPDFGVTARPCTQILESVINDVYYGYTAAQAQANTLAMLGYMSPYAKRCIVMGCRTRSNETTGTANFITATAYNTLMSAGAVGGGYVFYDWQADFLNLGADGAMARVGLTPTSADNAAVAAGVSPPSLLASDGVHPNDSGHAATALALQAIITKQNWT